MTQTEKPTSLDDLREFNRIAPETDKSDSNDVWHGSIYRNRKYHLTVVFPMNWAYDKGTSPHAIARALDSEHGISISVAIQLLPTLVPDSFDIYKHISMNEYKSMFSKSLNATNKTIVKEVDIEKSALNNLPAYLLTAKWDLTSMDSTLTFILRHISCLKDSKIYSIQMVLPLEYYNNKTELIFRSFVDSFKFEFH